MLIWKKLSASGKSWLHSCSVSLALSSVLSIYKRQIGTRVWAEIYGTQIMYYKDFGNTLDFSFSLTNWKLKSGLTPVSSCSVVFSYPPLLRTNENNLTASTDRSINALQRLRFIGAGDDSYDSAQLVFSGRGFLPLLRRKATHCGINLVYRVHGKEWCVRPVFQATAYW